MTSFTVRNTTKETIPPFAAMKLIGRGYVDSTGATVQAFLVAKPDADSMDTVVFNGPCPIMPGTNGQGYSSFPCPAAYSPETSTGSLPAVGEAWGTKNGEWTLAQGNTGFRPVQVDKNGNMTVMRSAVGAGAGSFDENISIATGVLVNGKYDAAIQTRDYVDEIWIPANNVWVVDDAGAPSLEAGALYPAIVARDENDQPVQEVGGPLLASIVNANTGNALTDATKWSLLLSPTATVWSAGTYPYGSYVSHSGHKYLQVNVAGTIDTPGASADWLQADTLNDAGGYSGGGVYRYNATTDTDYVQEVRGLYAIRSDVQPSAPVETIWCNNTVLAGVNTLRASIGIDSVTRLGAGIFTVVFTHGYATIHDFEWQGGAVGDALEEVPGTRTFNSVTVQTISGVDPLEWGISINGGIPGPNRTATLGMTLKAITFKANGIISHDRTGTLGMLLQPIRFNALGARSLPRTGTLRMALKPITFGAIGTSSNHRFGTLGMALKPVEFGCWGAISPNRTGTLGIALRPVTFNSWGAIASTRSGVAGWMLKPIAMTASGFVASSSGGGKPGASCDFRAKLTNVGVHSFGPTSAPVYAWAEQTPDANGNLIALAGGRSGTETTGPWMRELNDRFTTYPTFVEASFRGFDAEGVKIFDYENCCVGVPMDSVPPPARTGVLGMVLGKVAVTFSAAGTITGGGGGGGTVAPLGVYTSGGTPEANHTILNVTVQAGLLVLVFSAINRTGSPSVTFNGVPMAGVISIGYPGSVTGSIYCFSLAVPAGTHDLVMTAFPGDNDIFEAQLVNVTGLVNNTQYTANANSGGATTPTTPPISAPNNSVAIAGFFLQAPSGAISWAGAPTFTTGGQDLSDTVSATAIKQTEGYAVIPSALGSVSAVLNGVTVANWAGLCVVFN